MIANITVMLMNYNIHLMMMIVNINLQKNDWAKVETRKAPVQVFMHF